MFQDLTGKKFGRLTVIRRVENKGRQVQWLCECSCGNTKVTYAYSLTHGLCKSCGCLCSENTRKANTKHGGYKDRLYHVWENMKKRCSNQKSPDYKNYGGRGITICPEWADYANFRRFMIENGYNSDASFGECTIDRIDVNGPYSPENCRVVSTKEQSLNKTSSRLIEYNGVTKTVSEFADIYKIDLSTLCNRLNNLGYTVEQAIETEVRKFKSLRKGKAYKVGNESHTCKEWNEILGVKKSTMNGRLRRNNYDMTEVIRKYHPDYYRNCVKL